MKKRNQTYLIYFPLIMRRTRKQIYQFLSKRLHYQTNQVIVLSITLKYRYYHEQETIRQKPLTTISGCQSHRLIRQQQQNEK